MIADLPKLTDLTLTSPIGGGGGIGGGGSTVFGALLAVGLLAGLGACADPGLGRPSVWGAPAAVSELVTCRADVASGSISCAGPARASGTTTLGNQGLNVALRSSNVSYNSGSGILSADVTVQNLTDGPLNTTDGTTKSSGVRVFFVSGPTPDVGFAAVANPAGVATFTASNQPYFLYDTLLGSQAVSLPQTWQFALGGGATTFTFAVLVSTDVPVVGGILRWADEPGFLPAPLRGIRGWGSGFAVFGDFGEVLVYDQGKWTSRHDPGNAAISSTGFAGASGPNDLLRFTSTYGIRSWDGASWRSIESQSGGPGSSGLVSAVGSSAATGDYALGFSLWSHSGNSWTTDTMPTGNSSLNAATPVLGGILGMGASGTLWFFRQHNWTRVDSTASGTAGSSPYLVIAADTGHVWVFTYIYNGHAAEYWNGTSWSVPALPHNYAPDGYTVTGGFAVDSSDVYLTAQDVSGYGYLWHWDGSSWSTVRSSTGPAGHWYGDVTVTSNGNVYLAEEDGSVEMDSAGSWSTVLAGPPSANTTAPWVFSASDAWLGNNSGQVYHNDGTGWTKALDLGGGSIYSMWGAGGQVWAGIYDYNIEHYNGSSWSAEFSGQPIIAVGGSSTTDIWGVGYQSAIVHSNGSSWSTAASYGTLSSNDLHAVWAANTSAAFAVGVGGTIVAWNGSSWSLATSPTSSELDAVSGTSASDVWAVGKSGTIVHWNGSSWSTVSSGTSNDLTGVWARSPGEVYAVGAGATVLRYDGAAWAPVTTQGSSSASYSGVAGSAGGSALITGNWTLRGSR